MYQVSVEHVKGYGTKKKKSEKPQVGRTDGRTDGQTKRKPIVPYGETGRGLII